MKTKSDKSSVFAIICIVLMSFAFLFMGTASSPHYPINPWNDANAFFTAGKAMANGKLIYKDVFEQKGPLLYLIHDVAYRISHTSFLGVYIFEALAMSLTGIFAYKTAGQVTKPLRATVVAALTMATVICSPAFFYGDSAEEFVMPLMALSLYHLIRYLKHSNSEPKAIFFLVNGLIAGCVAMIKFSLLGFWLAWMALIALHTLIVKKSFKKAVISSLAFILGMAVAVAPWVIYFSAKGALKEFIDVYFVINATAYATDLSIKTRLLDTVHNVLTAGKSSLFATVTGALGLLFTVLSKKLTDGKFFSRIFVVLMCGIGMFFVYFGGMSHAYYFLPFTYFSVFFFIGIASLTNDIKLKKSAPKFIPVAAGAAVVAGLFFAILNFAPAPKYAPTDKENCPQYQINEYIQSNNPQGRILCANTLDMGVYLLSDYVPEYRYFELQNFEYEKYPENLDEINRYISEGEVDYVLAKTLSENSVEAVYRTNPELEDNYEVVLKQPMTLLNQADSTAEYDFYLFELQR